MEVEIHVSEEELAEFPEEATDSTAKQSQSGKTSQTPNQGTVQSLLLVRATPTPSLLRKIRKGYTRYVIRESPKSSGGSGSTSQYKRPYSVAIKNKRPRSLATSKIVYKRPGCLHGRLYRTLA